MTKIVGLHFVKTDVRANERFSLSFFFDEKSSLAVFSPVVHNIEKKKYINQISTEFFFSTEHIFKKEFFENARLLALAFLTRCRKNANFITLFGTDSMYYLGKCIRGNINSMKLLFNFAK